MSNYKEVYFNEYCSKCKYKDTLESDDPCDECLTNPSNIDSHKPINFKENNDIAKWTSHIMIQKL